MNDVSWVMMRAGLVVMPFKTPNSLDDLRDDIISDVAAGRMSPTQAEKWAADNGLRPFENKPEMGDHKISEINVWSLEMAVAWLIWRDLTKVTLFYKIFRENWITWQFSGAVPGRPVPGKRFAPPRPIPTFIIGKSKPATLRDVEQESSSLAVKARDKRQPVFMDYTSAINELTERLVDGSLAAHALSFETNRSLEVPSHEWRYLELRTANGASDAYMSPEPQPSYRRITFARAAVMSIWEARKPATPLQSARAGRPPGYDWNKLRRRAFEIIEKQGGWDPVGDPTFTNAEICRQLYGWMGKNEWKRQPSESVLKSRVAEFIKEFLRQGAEKSPR